ncbi:BTB domain-containing protein [Aphelenchoides bicaudatus]|nr:BTB domain-containing protein [Aphelenchoides bicaudatus]
MSTPEQRTLINLLEKEYKDGTNSDVEIQCGKRRFKASRFLLSIQSPVIKTMLDTSKSKCPCIKLNTSNVYVVESFLRFIYTGTLRSTDNEYLEMFKLADNLGVQHLKDTCFVQLSKNLSIVNLFDAIDFSYTHKLVELKPLIMEFLAKNLHQVTGSERWKKLDSLTRLDIMEGALLVQQATPNVSVGDNLLSLRIDPPIGSVQDPNKPLIHYLHNTGAVRLAYRVLYSSSAVFCPRPATGFIDPGNAVRLEIGAIDEQLLPYMLNVIYTEASTRDTNAWVLFNKRPRCKCADLSSSTAKPNKQADRMSTEVNESLRPEWYLNQANVDTATREEQEGAIEKYLLAKALDGDVTAGSAILAIKESKQPAKEVVAFAN